MNKSDLIAELVVGCGIIGLLAAAAIAIRVFMRAKGWGDMNDNDEEPLP